MYQPFNNNLILLKEKSQEETSSGIILSDKPTKTTFTVVKATKDYTSLLNKKVILKEPPQELENNYCVTSVDNIVAIEA